MKQFILAAVAIIFFAANTQAIVIDTFDDTSQSVTSGGGPAGPDIAAAPEAIGGVRTVEILDSQGVNQTTAAVVPSIGSYTHSNDAGNTFGSSKVSWDAGGADLTADNQFSIEIQEIDQGTVDITLSVNGVEVTVMDAGVGTLDIAYADFGGVDFSNVNAIMLQVDASSASDLILDLVETTNTGVPEPVTATLGLIGLAGLTMRRRRH